MITVLVGVHPRISHHRYTVYRTSACSKSAEPQKAADSSGKLNTEQSIETSVQYYKNIPEHTDFEGYNFRIAATWSQEHSWCAYLTTDEQDGSILNDSAYKRNLEVCEMLNISISEFQTDLATVQNSVLANDDSFDIVAYFQVDNVTSHLTQGILYDWKKLPCVNLTEEWYNQSANEVYTLNGGQYLAASMFTYPVQKYNPCLFNKELFDELQLEYPYQAVRDRKWTFELLMNYTKNAYADLDGDAKPSDGDRYGLCTNAVYSSVPPFIIWPHISRQGCRKNCLSINLTSSMTTDKSSRAAQQVW